MCDRTDEQLYDLEFKHTKSQKEEEELQKRISDIKCKFSKNNHFETKIAKFGPNWSISSNFGHIRAKVVNSVQKIWESIMWSIFCLFLSLLMMFLLLMKYFQN